MIVVCLGIHRYRCFRSLLTLSFLGRLHFRLIPAIPLVAAGLRHFVSLLYFPRISWAKEHILFIRRRKLKRHTKKKARAIILPSQRISVFVCWSRWLCLPLLLCIASVLPSHSPRTTHTTMFTTASILPTHPPPPLGRPHPPSCIYSPLPTGRPAPQTLHFHYPTHSHMLFTRILVVCINIPAAYLQDNRFSLGWRSNPISPTRVVDD